MKKTRSVGNGLTRRGFLKTGSALAAALVLDGCGKGVLRPSPAPARPAVVRVSGDKVPSDVPQAIKLALEPLGGLGQFVKQGDTVLLQPNLCGGSLLVDMEQYRATTSMNFVANVAKLVLDQGAGRVIVYDHAVLGHNVLVAALKARPDLNNPSVEITVPNSQDHFTQIEIPGAMFVKKTDIWKGYQDVDVHIALPLAKSHTKTIFTGTMKLAMGGIWDQKSIHRGGVRVTGDEKPVHKPELLDQCIADLSRVIRPNLVIMDGLKVMATNGPSGPGEIVDTQSIIAGTDPVAVDAAGAQLTPLFKKKVKPGQIKHLVLAEQAGAGKLDLSGKRMVSRNF